MVELHSYYPAMAHTHVLEHGRVLASIIYTAHVYTIYHYTCYVYTMYNYT